MEGQSKRANQPPGLEFDSSLRKLGSPGNPDPCCPMDDFILGMKEAAPGSDSSVGRRMSGGGNHLNKTASLDSLKSSFFNNIGNKHISCKGVSSGKRQNWFHKNSKSICFTIGLMGFFLWLDYLMFVDFDSMNFYNKSVLETSSTKDNRDVSGKNESSSVLMYGRLMSLASSSLAEKEFREDPSNLWKEPSSQASAWKPCADRKSSEDPGYPKQSNRFILVSANGGLNQQRVAVCNAVAVASLLKASLVIPRFLYSTVWKDPSQFGDIYKEEHFIKTMKDDITIVKELPTYLQSLDLEAIGSVVTDADLAKEAKPNDYIRLALPILLRNGVVHFLGFGNRLGFDPLTPHLQKLRCKCNFHALKFAPNIQKVGSLLVKRIRKYHSARNMLDRELLGDAMPYNPSIRHDVNKGPSKHIALHLRFEEDMVAYSQCDFGGGESEKNELQAYRETHFPLYLQRLKNMKPVSSEELRLSGRCPLTPEEAALVLSGLGLKRGTYIYLAGSHIYGGWTRMKPFTSLYPNLVTKEDLLTPSELEPFRNFSSQASAFMNLQIQRASPVHLLFLCHLSSDKLAALDFIACATADVFALTDSGSQLSSLVSGYRTYFGGGHAPTLRPNRKRLAAILLENGTIGWDTFQDRVKKMIEEDQLVHVRHYGQSIYRQPRSPECMCKSH
ncbi:hypothetical protein Cgig2_028813 [Carnegiea gigantea]|uniref:O-fucosyltransferase family protein n=1 Tax=Carnegiea gigantea TaxID=171969 RepID=A0A9Q1KR93_9CARY|nr:hypothetical protein Cgig2_028813 [Carnegiea gigantea]